MKKAERSAAEMLLGLQRIRVGASDNKTEASLERLCKLGFIEKKSFYFYTASLATQLVLLTEKQRYVVEMMVVAEFVKLEEMSPAGKKHALELLQGGWLYKTDGVCFPTPRAANAIASWRKAKKEQNNDRP